MKRLHVHVSVDELASSISFYSALFGADPVVNKPDYAKWLLDDPRVNFAISRKDDNATGLNHLGVQVETEDELAEVYERLGRANIASQPETCARCCYAESDKHWAVDPSGIVWEAYRTMGAIAVYGEDRGQSIVEALAAAPAPETTPSSCCSA
ncbi:ArsI/CadI family heavy metal resistance metalloenzyme [Novosphingobium sp. NDB2Meth1]|uniref:ArsI/CadI family heavy metal resistance metalloenzyme n=1 Tax=Novosphingobium sp. NDB2Meth1 TaxID=1892847 RepID=UPI0009307966|nr:ArsI/CadI family heavy metal resistance metalloenzyme [Novosphingobium sp. NDB2Meth1]